MWRSSESGSASAAVTKDSTAEAGSGVRESVVEDSACSRPRPERTRLRKKLSSAGGGNSRLRWASLIAEKIGCIDEAAHVPSSARWPTYEMTVAVEAGSADTPSSSQ